MSSQSPASVLYSSDGIELAVISNSPVPTGTRGILIDGYDGTNARHMAVDFSGNQIVVGAGVAGTPTGGVITIQGNPGGTPIPISGTVTASNPSVSNTGAAPPAQATYIGASVTTAAPTYTTGQLNALSLTTSGALRIDGSGSVQPISGTVTANQGTAVTLSGAWPVELTDGTNILGTSAHPVAVSGFITTNKAATSAVTSVAGSTGNTMVLASNANRIAATIFNGTNKLMYVKYGTAASTSSFSLQLLPNSYFEVQNDWTGEIDAVWANGVSGNALVSELTA